MNFWLSQNMILIASLLIMSLFSKSWALNLLVVFYLMSIFKMVIMRNHFLNFLILLEVFMIMGYMMIVTEAVWLSSSLSFMFVFMVIMVMGACVGMSLLVAVTRLMNKDMEMSGVVV